MITQTLLLVSFHKKLHYAELNGIICIRSNKLQKIFNEKPEVYLGECAGKHSEVILELNDKNLKVISDDLDYIQDFQAKFGWPEEALGAEGLVFGFDPIMPLEEHEAFFDDEADE
jgi:hypothetical protein